MADSPEPTDRGLTRRQVIQASAVAGAAAWTAPTVVDSLTSPAAAGTRVTHTTCNFGNQETDAVRFTIDGGTVANNYNCVGGKSSGITNSCLGQANGSAGSDWSNPCNTPPCAPNGAPWAALTFNTASCPNKWELFLTDAGQCYFAEDQNVNNFFVFAKYGSTATACGQSDTAPPRGHVVPQPLPGAIRACIADPSGGQALKEVSAIFCCPARTSGQSSC